MSALHDSLVQLFQKSSYQLSRRPANKRRLLLLQSHCYCYRQNFPHHVDVSLKIENILSALSKPDHLDSNILMPLIDDLIYECKQAKDFDLYIHEPTDHFTVGSSRV